MKSLFTLFLCLLLAASAAGQELKPKQDASGKWGFVDQQGNIVVPFQYDWVWPFSEGLAAVKLKNKWGYINQRNETVTPFQYSDAGSFKEGLARVEMNDKFGYIDKYGKTVTPCKYDLGADFCEGLASVLLNDRYGFIGKSGETVIPFKYDWADSFHDGLALVKLDTKYGFVDNRGNVVIPLRYDFAFSFNKGLASVRINDVHGYINTNGDWFASEIEGRQWLEQNPRFSLYVKRYVEFRINVWQKKGEFEKTSDWQTRVNESTRNRKIAELAREAEQLYIKQYEWNMTYTLGRYDADNEVYLIICNGKELLVPVPIAEAPAFKQSWESVVKTPKYFIENDRLAVAEVAFAMPGGKTYRYSNAASLQYTMAEVSYNFDPIEISVPETTAPAAGRQTVNRVTVTAGKSDVDVNIPQSRTTRDRTFAVIIANENYTKLSPVAYALNDGKTFGQYCHQTLGLPETNIRYYGDATYGTMLAAMSDIKKIATAYEGDIEVLFYYAGHGAPDEQQESYLMPVDAYGVGSEACYSLARLYKELGGLGARRVTVFLDACFSGSTREGTMLASARGVAIKPRSASPTGNMVVFTAAQGDETALPYRTQGHGLFTYYLLKKLQESGGEVTFGELGDYLTEQVSRRSQVVNRKSQTPAVLVSPSLGATWQTTPLVQ